MGQAHGPGMTSSSARGKCLLNLIPLPRETDFSFGVNKPYLTSWPLLLHSTLYVTGSMSAYLAEHLPHLQSLHAQLALDTTALQGDQERIETAIKAAVETLLRERELQVDEYKDVIAGQKRRLACLARAVGDKGRNVIQESRRESVENEVSTNGEGNGRGKKLTGQSLPKQLERLVKQSEELEKVCHQLRTPQRRKKLTRKVYDERLKHIESKPFPR